MEETYPRISSATPLSGKRLLVAFRNGVSKIYDCTPLLRHDVFRPLEDEALFRCAHADAHGHGVTWNDQIDLAESEIWLHGEGAEQGASADA